MNSKLNLKMLKEWLIALGITYGIIFVANITLGLFFAGPFNILETLPEIGLVGFIMGIFTILCFGSNQRLFNQFGSSRPKAFLYTLLLLLELAAIGAILPVFNNESSILLNSIPVNNSWFLTGIYRYILALYASFMSISFMLLIMSFLTIFKNGKIRIIVSLGIIVALGNLIANRVKYYLMYGVPQFWFKILAFFGISDGINTARFCITTVLIFGIPFIVISYFLSKSYKLNVRK